jgi:hypothetical protein
MSIPEFTMNGHFDSEPVFTTTSLRNCEKPELAAPVQNGRALPYSASKGDVTASPIPRPAMDGAMLLAQEIISGENEDGRESTRVVLAGVIIQHWRDQADGFFE